MSENNLNELWRLIEETDTTVVKEPSSYTLLGGLELEDVFPELEGSESIFAMDILDSSELSSSDTGEYWKVLDEMSPAPSTLTPSSTSHTESDSQCSDKQHPSSPTLASSLSEPAQPLSPTGSLVHSPKQIYPKVNIISGKLNSKKSLADNQDPQCNQFDARSEPILSNQSPNNFVGWLNGQQLYRMQEDTQDTDSTDSDENSEEVYIKKPPNAFMLFMNEQRPNISKELWRKGSGAVNSYLAAMWRSMSKEEQSPYFQMAAKLRQIHKMINPTWSNHLNYGKKRRRDRRKSRKFPLDPNNIYLTVNPGQPMQPRATLPTHLPQQPYVLNLPQHGPFVQSPFPQGCGMFIPDEGACTHNPPQELCTEGPAVGPVPQHVPEQ